MGPNPFWSPIPILIASMVASGGQFTWASVPDLCNYKRFQTIEFGMTYYTYGPT